MNEYKKERACKTDKAIKDFNKNSINSKHSRRQTNTNEKKIFFSFFVFLFIIK